MPTMAGPSPQWLKRQRDERRAGILAVPLALAIFAVDTLTEVEIAVAVLYAIALLIAARGLSRTGVVRLGCGFAGLTLLSFLLSHWSDMGLGSALRCAVSIAAILITTLLLERDQRSRELLVQTNAALARSEKRFRSIFEQARFSLWEQDYTAVRTALDELGVRDGADLMARVEAQPGLARRLTSLIATTNVNDATLELLGATDRAEVLGSLERFLPPDDPSMCLILRALVDGRDRYEGRARLIGLDGRPRTILLAIALPDDDVGLAQVVVGVVDITQREKTQEALLAAQAELARASRAATMGALSASIAHEVNQPLGAVVMNAQTCLRWLRRDPPDIEAAAKAAERTVRDGKRASEIVQRTRGMLVKSAPRDEAIDLSDLVRETALLLERELAAHGATLRTDLAAGVPPVTAGRVEMQQVLINLMTNGLQAMSEAGSPVRELTVSVSRPEPGLVGLSVRDSGAGIGEENLARLFDPFFTTKAEGMGMGLAICRSTIEARGGTLTARNHEGGGAAFDIVLPAGEGAS